MHSTVQVYTSIIFCFSSSAVFISPLQYKFLERSVDTLSGCKLHFHHLEQDQEFCPFTWKGGFGNITLPGSENLMVYRHVKHAWTLSRKQYVLLGHIYTYWTHDQQVLLSFDAVSSILANPSDVHRHVFSHESAMLRTTKCSAASCL